MSFDSLLLRSEVGLQRGCKCAVLTTPKGQPLQPTALGAPHETVLTQGSKGEFIQNPCVKIVICGGLLWSVLEAVNL